MGRAAGRAGRKVFRSGLHLEDPRAVPDESRVVEVQPGARLVEQPDLGRP